jgi:rhamnulokinase
VPAPTSARYMVDNKKVSQAYLAFDLGAESGRALLGGLRNDRLELQEIHRFPNGPVRVGNSLHWDILRLWGEMKKGLALAYKETGASLVSLGVDAWGVDFGLLDKNDNLIGNPYHYRDQRTDGILETVSNHISLSQIYQQTGVQIMPINSLYQLYSMVISKSPQLAVAQTFLNIPDLFNFWFSGEKVSEYSIATTTQCYCPSTHAWAWDLLNKLQVPDYLFGRIVSPGTVLGKLRSALVDEIGGTELNVLAVASHDTQSAIAAIPSATQDYLYISSGTWSLIGIEVEQLIITEMSRMHQLTNEGGYGGKICFLKNIMGLWLLQECRREWARKGREYSYDELAQMAITATPLHCFINPTDPVFLTPGDMVARIQACCRTTAQPVPSGTAEVVRCILESLALEYRHALQQISELTGFSLPVIHITGGGSRNDLLNQFTANATGRAVIAGPVEATALGNILVQSIASGEIASLAEGRALVRRSVEMHKFEPAGAASWEQAYNQYLKLRQNYE